MLSYWDPFSDLSRTSTRRQTFKPAVDIYEDGDSIHVRADFAGVKPEDIKVEVENRILTIHGERKNDHEYKRDGYKRMERIFGTFSRSFELPEAVNSDDIEAIHEHGVLTIRLPKRQTAKRREITVRIPS